MSLGANLLSIFVPSYFLTVTYNILFIKNYKFLRFFLVSTFPFSKGDYGK